jgi:hypothetical protein
VTNGATAVTRTRAAEYRNLAQGCLELARSVSTEEARLALIGMASRWFQLAQDQDDESADLVGGSVPAIPMESPRPAVQQQQQQVQPKAKDKED